MKSAYPYTWADRAIVLEPLWRVRCSEVFDKLAHDMDCRRFVFDLDGDLAAYKLILTKWANPDRRVK
jgi:hypothetical protein